MGLARIIFTDPSWFWDRGGCEEPGKCWCALFRYTVWVWVTWVGVSGTVIRFRARKTRKPFTAAADLLENHPLTSTDRKLMLNSQGRGPRAQRPQKRGGVCVCVCLCLCSGPQASTFSFAAAETAAAVAGGGGGQKVLVVLHPFPETPKGRHPCPGACLPPRARLPRTTPAPRRTPESPLPSEPNPHPSRISQSHQGPGKPPTRQGRTS